MREKQWDIRLMRALKDRQASSGLWQSRQETEAFQAGVMRDVTRLRVHPKRPQEEGFSEAVWRLVPLTSLAAGGLAVILALLSHGSEDLLNLALIDTSVYVEHLIAYMF
ncbi:hypothetical protein [Desulfoluna butyratoxydans]|uniref:Uncharacterized protein n=1 Tax=Desulfoluna butyratoxydans TaxID=231438 RepID=A0A4U8YNQ1_9BACT|nr:hypothetical protein [Desulfoluna butyratoxydans]VFQ45765.1 hypothetical protein MSL71_34270 [Desulfoluna butyratoxydans]